MSESDRRLAIGAAVLAVLAALLAWVFLHSSSFGNSVRTGVECRDGLVTAVLGLIGVGLLTGGRPAAR